MDTDNERGLLFSKGLALFLSLTFTGVILNFIYSLVAIDTRLFSPAMSVVVCLAYAGVLQGVCKKLLKIFKLADKKTAYIAVCLALLITTYVKWNVFFAINLIYWTNFEADVFLSLKYVLYVSTVTFELVLSPRNFFFYLVRFNEIGISPWLSIFAGGPLLAIIWMAETFVLWFFPLKGTKTAVELNELREIETNVIFSTVHFVPFTEPEVKSIAAGNYEGLRHKALSETLGIYGAVGVYKNDYGITGKVALFNVRPIYNGEKRYKIGKTISAGMAATRDIMAIVDERAVT